MLSDAELLRRYVEDGSQEAFAELVGRHLNLVYHSALRRVGRNAHAADDVTQAVFTGLARKARSLQQHPNLAGWLYTATRFAAADSVRSERRRRKHEQEAETMKEMNSEPPVPAERLEPFLDEALDLMDQRDREAVLLHYFEGHTFAEVGAALSLSADAARMRVKRALERLRGEFARRGVASTAAAVAAALTAQTLMSAAAPSALTVAGRALSQVKSAPGFGASRPLAAVRAVFSGWGLAALVLGLAVSGGAWIGLRETSGITRALRGGTSDRTDVAEAATPANLPSPAETASAATPAVSDFDRLTSSEKNVLRRLWQIRMDRGPGFALNIAPQTPNATDFEVGSTLLETKQLAARLPAGGTRLTADGIAFCAQQWVEVESYPLVYNNQWNDFSALADSEQKVLKRLWLFQSQQDLATRTLIALKPPHPSEKAAIFADGRERLLGRRFVAPGRQEGAIHLTDLGLAYCRAHAAELEPVSSDY